MQIKKSQLEVLSNALAGTEGVLNLADSRLRDSFAKPLKEATDTFVQDREKIYLKFCMRKKDDTPDLTPANQYQFKTEVMTEMTPEIALLLEETVDLPTLLKLKEFIEKTNYAPKIGEAEVLDEIIKAL